MLAKHLKTLKNGQSIVSQIYDFTLHKNVPSATIEPCGIIIVDGFLLFAIPEINALFDLKIFMDADDDVRLLRRIKRDQIERGLTAAEIQNQYFATVKPMHEQFTQPSKQHADLIIPATRCTDGALMVLEAFIKSRTS